MRSAIIDQQVLKIAKDGKVQLKLIHGDLIKNDQRAIIVELKELIT